MDTMYKDLAQMQSQQSYTDLQGLQSIKKNGKDNQDLALRQVAQQFESMFIQMMLKSMRSANEVFGKDNPLNSFEAKHHQEMYDNQLSLSLSASNNIGLADAFYRQMQKNYLPNTPNSTASSASAMPERSHTNNSSYFGISIPQRIKDASALKHVQSPEDFINAIKPYAQQAAKAMGVDYRVLIAQSALETGWGDHIIRDKNGNQSFNLFNIKADSRWQGRSIAVPTLEYVNGIAQKEVANFRRYGSIEDSFSDYQEFLTQPRYKKAMTVSGNANQFIEELQNAGYATDPKYAEKIQHILQQHLSDKI